jgi:hypothetical protein
MALDHSTLAQLIAEHGPYLYHGTVEHCVPLILEQGLEPGWSGEERTTHVFLGDKDAAATWAHLRGAGELAQIRVDLRELDPQFIDVDPDFWIGEQVNAGDPYMIEDGYLALDEQGTPLRPEANGRLPDGQPQWVAADIYFLSSPSPAEDTLRSFVETGCVAYRGQVPASAVTVNPEWAVELVRQGKKIPGQAAAERGLQTDPEIEI